MQFYFTQMKTPRNKITGVNMSARKSGTERTKKRKKRELVFFPTARGRNWYGSPSSRRYADFAQSTITRTRHILYPAARTKSQTDKTHKMLQLYRPN